MKPYPGSCINQISFQQERDFTFLIQDGPHVRAFVQCPLDNRPCGNLVVDGLTPSPASLLVCQSYVGDGDLQADVGVILDRSHSFVQVEQEEQALPRQHTFLVFEEGDGASRVLGKMPILPILHPLVPTSLGQPIPPPVGVWDQIQ